MMRPPPLSCTCGTRLRAPRPTRGGAQRHAEDVCDFSREKPRGSLLQISAEKGRPRAQDNLARARRPSAAAASRSGVLRAWYQAKSLDPA